MLNITLKPQGTPPHRSLSLLISVDCACVEHYPECTVSVLGKMSGGHYTLNRVTAYGPVAEKSASVQNPRFLCNQVILNYEVEIVHNRLDMAVTTLMMYHCCFCKSLLLGRKCVQFQ